MILDIDRRRANELMEDSGDDANMVAALLAKEISPIHRECNDDLDISEKVNISPFDGHWSSL